MTDRKSGHQLGPSQNEGIKDRVIDGCNHESHIHRPIIEPRKLLPGCGLKQFELDGRIQLLECLETDRQNIESRTSDKGDAQHTSVPARHEPSLLPGSIRIPEQSLGLFIKEATGRSQENLPVVALKEDGPDFRFQLVDLLAQGRLSDMHGFRSTPEVKVLCDSNEVSDLTKFHWGSLLDVQLVDFDRRDTMN